jgi:hypothetical protein
MLADAHAPAFEPDALAFEPQPLFECVLAPQQNPAARAEHAMPRRSRAAVVQRPRHLARRSLVSRRARDVAVCGHFPFRNAPDRRSHFLEHSIN